jgi:hypothetical protein
MTIKIDVPKKVSTVLFDDYELDSFAEAIQQQTDETKS